MKQFIKHKKGVLDNLSTLIIGIASLAIVAVVVFLILANLAANTDVAADNNASTAVTTLTVAAAGIPGWVPLVVITVIGGLLIALVAIFRRGKQ